MPICPPSAPEFSGARTDAPRSRRRIFSQSPSGAFYVMLLRNRRPLSPPASAWKNCRAAAFSLSRNGTDPRRIHIALRKSRANRTFSARRQTAPSPRSRGQVSISTSGQSYTAAFPVHDLSVPGPLSSNPAHTALAKKYPSPMITERAPCRSQHEF